MDKVLVYGATGAQGSAVVRRLLERGHQPVGLARTPAEADHLKQMGADAALGTFEAPESLQRASHGVNKVFLVIPLGLPAKTVRQYGEAAIAAARQAGVERLVFNTSTRIPDEVSNVDAFEEKRALEAYLADSGVPFISLRPTFYMGNFLGPWTKPGIVREGVVAYPVPPELRVSWISWEDMAAFTVAALERPELSNRTFDVGGPEALDGEGVASSFSEALGRTVRYVMVPHDAFERGLSSALGAQTGKSVAQMYRWMVGRERTALFTADAGLLNHTFGVEGTPLKRWIRQQNWRLSEGLRA